MHTSWTPTIFFLYRAHIQSYNIYFFENYRRYFIVKKKIKLSLQDQRNHKYLK